jgi:type VI secretion system protein ImpL
MLSFITNPWLIRVLGLLGIIVFIWYLGPLIGLGPWYPFQSVMARVIFVVAVVLVWFVQYLLKARRSKKAEKELGEKIVAGPIVPEAGDESVDERSGIKKSFEEALAVLKKSRGKKGRINLYELPWYIMIGPPGSGKTTALVNSGLKFPLADRFGPEIKGVGGTRKCDWLFTDDAILIDTAGRYTTQDSDSKVDQAGWFSFLDLLKRYRKRRPINGVFVAISVTDLITQTEQQRRAHAVAINKRVAELDKHFGIRFPVYVLFTKTDLLAGFMEFFDDLRRTEREQVWGMTFPYSDDAGDSPVGSFGPEFDLLLGRLNDRLLSRIGDERDLGRRALIHGFPRQMAAVKEVCAAFLADVFQDSRYGRSPMLRGVYFTSGTQEGTPMDRLMGSVARTFQLDAQVLAPQTSGGKSFFITDMLRKVAFRESELAGTNRRLEFQRAWLQRGTYAVIAAAFVLLGLGWAYAYARNVDYVDRMSADTQRAEELIAAVDSRDYDPLAVLPALDAVRTLPGGYADQLAGGGWFGDFGLSQRDKLGDGAVASYRRLLVEMFLPRIMLRLEDQLQRGGLSPDYTYEALKAYLMLDSRDHYDPASIRAFIEFDWDANLQRQVSTEQRQALSSHLAALFEERPNRLPLPLNDTVVARARAEVRAFPLDERIYSRLVRTFSADIPGFNIRDAAGGPTAELVFVRKSGVPLSTPVPPLFTKQAYQNVFVDESKKLTAELAGESWILGEEISDVQQDQLLAKVRDRYLDEYVQRYSAAILDVGLVPFGTPTEAARLFNILAQPSNSPLALLLTEVARQTSLDQSEGDAAEVDPGGVVAQARDRLRNVLGGGGPAQPAAVAAPNPVAVRFKPLNALVAGQEGQPRPIDHLLSLFQDLSRYLTVVASEAAGGAVPPNVQQQGQAVVQQLRIASGTQPNMLVGELLDTAAGRTSALTTGGLRAYLNDLWRAGPLTVCRQAIAGRYPVAANSAQTIRLADFGEFFGYGGHMERFFNENLRAYVDATASPWRPRATANLPIRLSADALRAFEYADVIRRTFFRPGSMQPSVSFDLRPLEMDPQLSHFLLNLEGAVAEYDFGPATSKIMQWPGPNPETDEVRLEFRTRQGTTAMVREQGPWAWFRLLDQAGLKATSVPEQFEVRFTQGGQWVLYQLTARSAFNPFAMDELRQFACPTSL